MVSQKERMIEARRARVPITRVSAGYEAADRRMKRSSAMLLLGLLAPLVVACVVVMTVLLQGAALPSAVGAEDDLIGTRPANDRPVLETRGPVQKSLDRFTIDAEAGSSRLAALPIVDGKLAPAASPKIITSAEPLAEPQRSADSLREPIPEPDPCIDRVADAAARTMVWFPSKSAQVSKEHQAVLRRLAERLAGCPTARVEVGGHADDARDATENAQLSFQRAQAVSRILSAGGVASGQISPVAYGASRPLSKSQKAQDVALNRRVDLVIR